MTQETETLACFLLRENRAICCLDMFLQILLEMQSHSSDMLPRCIDGLWDELLETRSGPDPQETTENSECTISQRNIVKEKS